MKSGDEHTCFRLQFKQDHINFREYKIFIDSPLGKKKPIIQNICFYPENRRIEFNKPETNFTCVLKKNEGSFKKILATSMKVENPNEINFPFSFQKKSKQKALPENFIVYDIICLFAPIMWNGESISAYGIQKALEWSYIDKEDYPSLARKIIIYFTEVRKQQYEKTKAMTKKGATQKQESFSNKLER